MSDQTQPTPPDSDADPATLSELDLPDTASPLDVRTYFVRGRNALLARAQFEPLYVDYYLHQGQISVQHAPFHDELFKELLAAITLHAASRPWTDTMAWTLHFQLPMLNLFATADNSKGRVAGQIFNEEVRDTGQNTMFADLARSGHPSRRSSVEVTSRRPFGVVEEFYRQSEQRLGRFFAHGEEDFVFITAQPQCDLAWLESLTVEDVRQLDQTETLSLMENRVYHWECGCTEERMMQVLSPVMRSDAEGLYGESDVVRMRCPRCGQRYAITREALEAYLAG